MSQVFISYSRKDKPFVQRLFDALTHEKRDTWADWDDIPPTAKWLQEIYGGIEAADNFVFVISPDSVTSKPCAKEIEHAERHNKRFIPILVRHANREDIPDVIRIHNWIYFDAETGFEESFQTLLKAIDTDLEYVRVHTQLLLKAREWSTYRRDASYMLMGSELEQAREWLAKSGQKQPKPLRLQREFVNASLQAAQESQEQRQARQRYLALRDTSLQSYIRPYLVQRKKDLDDSQARLTANRFLKFSAEVMNLDEGWSALSNFLDQGGKWHPQDPISIRQLGPQEDYLEVFQFPCCGTQVLANRAPSHFRSDGCQASPIMDGEQNKAQPKKRTARSKKA